MLIAAWAGTRMDSSWWVPRRSASRTLASTLLSERSTHAASTASYVPRRRIVPDASSVAKAASRPARPCCRRIDGQREVGVGVVDPDGLEHVVGRDPGRVHGATRRGRAAARPLAPAPGVSHRRGASCTSALRRPGRPRVGDDLGQLVAVDLAEPRLLDQHGVEAAEVVDGEERQPVVLDERQLVPLGRGVDHEQVVVHLAGLRVDGRAVRRPVEDEPLAAHGCTSAGHPR